MITACAIWKFKAEHRAEMLEFMKNHEDGFKVTREWPGCVSLECRHSLADDETILIWGRFNERADFDSYMKMRKDTKFFHPWIEKMTAPPDFHVLSDEEYCN